MLTQYIMPSTPFSNTLEALNYLESKAGISRNGLTLDWDNDSSTYAVVYENIYKTPFRRMTRDFQYQVEYKIKVLDETDRCQLITITNPITRG